MLKTFSFDLAKLCWRVAESGNTIALQKIAIQFLTAHCESAKTIIIWYTAIGITTTPPVLSRLYNPDNIVGASASANQIKLERQWYR